MAGVFISKFCILIRYFSFFSSSCKIGMLSISTRNISGSLGLYVDTGLLKEISKQVAQRATIAHLSPMCQHPLISNKPASKVIKNLNSFQIREQLFFSGLSTSNVSRLNVPEIKPLVVFKHVLVTKEQARMETSLSHYNSLEYFSNTQAPLIPQ